MLTREVREWLDKVKRGAYSYEDAMCELIRFSRFLSKEEIIWLKTKIEESFHQIC